LVFARANASGDRNGIASMQLGVGHPFSPHKVEALADVRGADARSTETDRPCGVADSFQVSLYKVEPRMSDRCFNLLAKYCDRVALRDEVEESGP
jgi:hypothetical protein